MQNYLMSSSAIKDMKEKVDAVQLVQGHHTTTLDNLKSFVNDISNSIIITNTNISRINTKIDSEIIPYINKTKNVIETLTGIDINLQKIQYNIDSTHNKLDKLLKLEKMDVDQKAKTDNN